MNRHPPALRPAADPRDCECERRYDGRPVQGSGEAASSGQGSGTCRPQCRAGLFGRLARTADGERVWVFDPLPCWLDASRLCPGKRPDKPRPVAPPGLCCRCRERPTASPAHKMCAACIVSSNAAKYRKGRHCAACGCPLTDAARGELCRTCGRASLTPAISGRQKTKRTIDLTERAR